MVGLIIGTFVGKFTPFDIDKIIYRDKLLSCRNHCSGIYQSFLGIEDIKEDNFTCICQGNPLVYRYYNFPNKILVEEYAKKEVGE